MPNNGKVLEPDFIVEGPLPDARLSRHLSRMNGELIPLSARPRFETGAMTEDEATALLMRADLLTGLWCPDTKSWQMVTNSAPAGSRALGRG